MARHRITGKHKKSRRDPIPGLWVILLLAALGWSVVACQGKRALTGERKTEMTTSVDLRERLQTAGSAQNAWKIVRRMDSFDGYRNFLLVYPQGEYAGQARTELPRYETELWSEVEWALQTHATITDYLLWEYLDLYPQGAHAGEVRRRYDALPDSARWYTLEFNDRNRAGLLFGPVATPVSGLDKFRLRGLADYLLARPRGILGDWLTEKFVRTYISTPYLLLLPDEAGRQILLNPSDVARLQDGLAQYPGLPAGKRALADAYLRAILLRESSFSLRDDNSNSIIDDLEFAESLGLERETVFFSEKFDKLDKLGEGGQPEVLPSLPESSVEIGEIRPPDQELLPETTRPERPPQGVNQELAAAEIADEHAASIRQGRYEYDPIPVLEVDTPFFFQLKIFPFLDSLLSGPAEQPRPGGVIPVSSEMSVRILPADPSAFSIRAVSDSTQPVGVFQDSTVWSWWVTPLRAGRHQVVISIDILTYSNAIRQPLRRSITVASEMIQVVAVDPGVQQDDSLSLFSSPLWWSLLLLAPALFLLFYLRRRRRQSRTSILLGEGSDDPLIEKIQAEQLALRGMQNDLKPQLDRTEEAIAAGDTGKALNGLLDFFRNRHKAIYGELLGLSAQFRQYQRASNLGLNPDSSIPNRINHALIQLMTYIRNALE